MQAHPNPAIAKAMQHASQAEAKAAADPTRPKFHFRPPANWMNDPNGPLYIDQIYHLFYQYNPYGDAWGHIHWGHARSRDLVRWEHQPIALWPSEDLDEAHCFSGCGWVNGQGQPMLFYTKVGPGDGDERPPNEQWAALGDDDLLMWEKHPDNPILSLETHGGPDFKAGWRDPFIFTEAGRVFLVLGGDTDDETMVALYETEDPAMVKWTFRGLLCRAPLDQVRFYECPNFCKVDGRWILLTSPYRPIEYQIGDFDLDSLTFAPQTAGVLDPGASGDIPNFYASNIVFDDQDRCILLGWVRGFQEGRGWNGCLALPRILSIDEAGLPRQRPVPELQKLRDNHQRLTELPLQDEAHHVNLNRGDMLEVAATFAADDAKAVGLRLKGTDEGGSDIDIRYDGQQISVLDTVVPFELPAGEKLQLHLYLDKSVLELFVNDGRLAVTRIVYGLGSNPDIELFAEGGSATVETVDVWTINPIW